MCALDELRDGLRRRDVYVTPSERFADARSSLLTIYTQRALDHIAATTGSQPRDEDIERLSPLGSDHTTLTGRYRVRLPAALHDRRAYRSLRGLARNGTEFGAKPAGLPRCRARAKARRPTGPPRASGKRSWRRPVC